MFASQNWITWIMGDVIMGYGAGDYGDRLKWYKQSIAKDELGQDVESFADNGLLWGNIEVTNGTKQTSYGAAETGWDAMVKIRNMPPLRTQDRLYSVEWQETYVIEHIARGNNELICQCVKYDELGLQP